YSTSLHSLQHMLHNHSPDSAMVKLDDTEFSQNSIIDLVVLPDMPVHSIIAEMIRPIACKVILDTQGNLRRYFSSEGALQEDRETKYPAERQHFENRGSAQNNEEITVNNTFEEDKIGPVFGKNDIPTSSSDYTLDDPEQSHLISDMMTSSMEYLSQHFLEMEEDDENTDVRYYSVDDFADFCKKLEELKNISNYVLVIDSITFACDSSPFELQMIINMLWSLVYTCNATVITINHYRVGKVERTYRLVPRMGARWGSFVSYQVLFKYKRDSLVFTVVESALSKRIFLHDHSLLCITK
ncbi:hypothetical protein PAEPH01_2124, partial [Pancytospora epiphaga]